MFCTWYNLQYNMSRNSIFLHSPGRGPLCGSDQAASPPHTDPA